MHIFSKVLLGLITQTFHTLFDATGGSKEIPSQIKDQVEKVKVQPF